MSANPNWREFGPRIPFPRPVDFSPDFAWDEEPTLSLSVNEDWIPLLNGAMKVLLCEETYERDDDAIRTGYIESIDEILTAWQHVDGPVAFHLSVSVDGGTSVLANYAFQDQAGRLGFANDLCWSGFFINGDPENHSINLQLFVKDVSENDAGGHFDQIQVAGFGSGGLTSIALWDCFDDLFTANTGTFWNLTDDFTSGKDLTHMQILSTSAYLVVHVYGHGPLACGEA